MWDNRLICVRWPIEWLWLRQMVFALRRHSEHTVAYHLAVRRNTANGVPLCSAFMFGTAQLSIYELGCRRAYQSKCRAASSRRPRGRWQRCLLQRQSWTYETAVPWRRGVVARERVRHGRSAAAYASQCAKGVACLEHRELLLSYVPLRSSSSSTIHQS